MDLQELNSLIADFVQVGYMEAVKSYEPPQDLIRVAEVKRWLRMIHVDAKCFNRLVKEGIIRTIRKGTGRNSPLYYSKSEIKQALSIAKVGTLIAKGIVRST